MTAGSQYVELANRSVLPFSKLNYKFFGYFDPEFFFSIVKISNFRGEQTDISAKKDALKQILNSNRMPVNVNECSVANSWCLVGSASESHGT